MENEKSAMADAVIVCKLIRKELGNSFTVDPEIDKRSKIVYIEIRSIVKKTIGKRKPGFHSRWRRISRTFGNEPYDRLRAEFYNNTVYMTDFEKFSIYDQDFARKIADHILEKLGF